VSAAVVLDGVSKRYRFGDGSWLAAADRVSLRIGAGRRTALVGPSGSGKSTRLHLISAIDVPNQGRITAGDVEVTALGRCRLADFRTGVGFMFQQFDLLAALTIADNVAAPLVMRVPVRQARARAGLADRAGARPRQLSGGQQQRVAIARALVVQPSLLLADEPTGNLDSTTAAEIMQLLGDVQRRFMTTLVIATHDAGVATRCDDVVEVWDGRARMTTADGVG